MNAATLIILFCLVAPAQPASADLLAQSRRQPISEVAAELDTLSHLSPAAFDVAAPSIINLLRTTRSSALKVRALDMLCAKANANRVAELAGYLDECLDGLQQDRRRAHYDFIEAFVSSDLTTWGAAMRSSPATLAFLNRLVRYRPPDASKSDLNPTVGDMAGETIFLLMPSVAAKRQAMLVLIRDRTRGSDKAALLLPPIADTATVVALRTILSQGELNFGATRALVELGDAGALPILERHRDSLQPLAGQPPHHDRLEFAKRAIQGIQTLQDNATLLAFIRSPASDGHLFPFNRFWAVRKAKERNVPPAELRAAVLDWASNAPGQIHLIQIKHFARKLGILEPTDLPDTPDSDLRQRMSHAQPPKRRSGPAPVPTRKAKGKPWSPNAANYEALGVWMNTVQWEALSGVEASRLLKGKLCELNLLHPTNCEGSP